jgi:hypothetical protein
LSLREPGFELVGARAVDVCDEILDRVGGRLVNGVGAVGIVDGDHTA